MRSRFAGKCACCNKPFPAGEEIDYFKGEGAYLPGHRKEPEPEITAEVLELAERLGFRPHAEAMDTDRALPLLSSADRSDEPGRG